MGKKKQKNLYTSTLRKIFYYSRSSLAVIAPEFLGHGLTREKLDDLVMTGKLQGKEKKWRDKRKISQRTERQEF